MKAILMWLIFGRWALVGTVRDMDYMLHFKKERDMNEFYFALVQNNFCGSRNSYFIRRDMKRILGLEENHHA
ncbi:TPA: hypothetical protein ACPZUW_001928 [Yersinia enterocolitica]